MIEEGLFSKDGPFIFGNKGLVVKNSEAVGLLLVNFSRSGQVHCEVALASWQRCLAKQALAPMDVDPYDVFLGLGKKRCQGRRSTK